MSELLGQNVSLIYYFVKEAVSLNFHGYPWQGLEMLRTAAALCYKEKGHVELDKTKATIQSILEDCAVACRAQRPETLQALREEYLNGRAQGVFTEHLEALRDYMQTVGYYQMMNQGWGREIVEMETVTPIKEKPKSRTFPTELSSDVVNQTS